MFLLHGNVYDAVIYDGKPLSLSDFLAGALLRDSKQTIVLYNVATGVRFAKRKHDVDFPEELLAPGAKDRTLAALETLLTTGTRSAVMLEYADAVAPTGDPAFQADADRAAAVMLHRWSFLPAIERGDNVVLLIAENLTDFAQAGEQPEGGGRRGADARPRGAARRGAARRPAPRRQGRRALRRDHRRPEGDPDRRILAPAPPARRTSRRARPSSPRCSARRATPRERAHKLAALTAGMTREEIRKLLAPDGRRRRTSAALASARAGDRPPHRAAQARDPRARVLRPGRVRRAAARLRGGRRHGRGQEGPAARRREHPRGPHAAACRWACSSPARWAPARPSSPRPSPRSAA